MASDLLPIKIPPGMFRNGTEYEASGRWYDGDLVRFENGRLKPIGGWQALLAPGVVLTGVARGGLAWEDNLGFKYYAIGTNSKLYIGTGGIFTDITPSGFVPGRADSLDEPGYGAGPYGDSTYGTARTTDLQVQASTWAMDTYGQDLICVMNSDQKIYEFDPTAGTVAQITNSPTALSVFVTNEDFIMALGAGGVGRTIEWPDIDDNTVWTPSDTNSAGSINLNSGGRCMCGSRVGVQNIAWTDMDTHLINYIGPPGIYGPVRIAENCGIVGPNAFVVTDVAFWWSWGGFFTYNGLVQPLPCAVQDYIWRNVNWSQAAKIYGEANSRFNEVTWFFPSLNSMENDSYVTLNTKDGSWSFGIGSILGARTTWVDRGVFPLPLAVDPSGVVYQHETGYLANGVTRVGSVFAQSGPAQVGNGAKVIYCNLILPDVDPNPGSVEFSAVCRNAPQGPATTVGPVSLMPNAEGYVPARFAGRQAAMRIDQTADTDWSVGTIRVKAILGGGR